jgi:hypothetical protein
MTRRLIAKSGYIARHVRVAVAHAGITGRFTATMPAAAAGHLGIAQAGPNEDPAGHLARCLGRPVRVTDASCRRSVRGTTAAVTIHVGGAR